MKDQLRLLRDCINNDRPAVVFQGDDFCAPEILEAAKEIYRKHGCSEEFLFDWQLLINEVKAYQLEVRQLSNCRNSPRQKRNWCGKR